MQWGYTMNRNNYPNSTEVSRGECNKCDSSDGNILYDDGHQYCYVCETYTHSNKKGDTQHMNVVSIKESSSSPSLPDLKDTKVGPLKDRKIVIDTIKHYKVRLKLKDGIVTEHYYPYTNSDGDTIAYKKRTVSNKSFMSVGDIRKGVLFGQSLFTKGGRYITVCEGEIDTMSAFQMQGSKYACVGVKSSSDAYKQCKREYEYLDSYDNIIVCMDNDEPGKKAANMVASLFPKKAKIVKLKLNDIGEYLERSKESEFTHAWWQAEKYRATDIISGHEAAYAISKQPRAEAAFHYPWAGLNKKTYGMRCGEMTTLIAGSGSGKTSVSREIAYQVLKHNVEAPIGLLYLEETAWETTRGLISLDLSKPIHLPDCHYTEDEHKQGSINTWGTERVHSLNDSWENNSIDFIADKISYFAKGLDCKLVILDHISFMVSDNDSNDERRSLDAIAHKLKALTVELDIHLLIIAHTKRVSGKPLEEGGTISLSDIRGTAGIGQLSNIVMGIERNGQSDDPIEANTTTIRVVKNRFCGRTGVATRLFYDEHTGRMTEVEETEDD